MADATVTANMETIWCVSCAAPTIVTVAIMNNNRNHGQDVFCSACGRRYNKREDAPMEQVRRLKQEEEVELGERCKEEARLGHVIGGLRGTITRLQRQLDAARGKGK